MHTPDELVGLYRDRGLKITPQRQAVFAALHENARHPTAESVHDAITTMMPAVSLRTVYSVLSELTEMREINQLDLGTGSARFDPRTTPHHHLVCDRCGLVRDVTVDHPDVRPVSEASSGASEPRFRITGTEIVFRGHCGECSAAGSTATGR